jgi:hypothetical protein
MKQNPNAAYLWPVTQLHAVCQPCQTPRLQHPEHLIRNIAAAATSASASIKTDTTNMPTDKVVQIASTASIKQTQYK